MRIYPRSTLVCLAALLLAALSLYSVTDGNLSVHGDDVLIFARHTQYSPNAGISGYFHNIGGRAFLTPAYIAIYDSLGSNPWNTHIFFLFLHAVNVMLCFLTLRKIFDIRPALVGALFYLFYAGSYETLTWISAGAYLIVMAVFFVCVQIALSGVNAWAKGAIIALLTWLSVHLYEVLMAAAPLYPLLTAVAWRRKGRRIWTLDFVPAFLPLAAVSFHAVAIYVAKHATGDSLWMRNASLNTDPWSLVESLWHTGELAFTTCCGLNHWNFLSTQIRGILSWHFLGFGYLAFLSLAIAAVAWVWIRNPVSGPAPASNIFLALLAGGYLVLISPLIAFTVVDTFFPSRLLVLCAAGLALLAATLVAKWPKYFVIGLVLSAGAVEALSLQSVLLQEQTSNAVDSNIRGQLLNFHLAPHVRDRFFFSLPSFPERTKLWKTSFSQFDGGGEHIMLVYEYGFLRSDTFPWEDCLPLLRRQIRGEGAPELNVPVPAPGDTWQLYPFTLADGSVLKGINPVEVKMGDRVLRRYENLQFASLPAGRLVPGRAAAAWYDDGKLRLNFYEPDLELEIHGQAHQAPPSARLDVKDGERLVVSLPLVATGDFIGRIPLSSLRPDSVLTFSPAGGADWEFQTTAVAPASKPQP